MPAELMNVTLVRSRRSAMVAVADGVGEAGVEVLGPIAIEAALDDQLGPVAGDAPRDLHGSGRPRLVGARHEAGGQASGRAGARRRGSR